MTGRIERRRSLSLHNSLVQVLFLLLVVVIERMQLANYFFLPFFSVYTLHRILKRRKAYQRHTMGIFYTSAAAPNCRVAFSLITQSIVLHQQRAWRCSSLVFFFLFFFLSLSFHDIWCCGSQRCTSLRRSCSNSSIERRNVPVVCRTTTIHLTRNTIPTTFFFVIKCCLFFCPPLLISSKCQIKDVRRPHVLENRVATQSLRCDCVWGHFVSWSTPFLRECTGEVRRELERTFYFT